MDILTVILYPAIAIILASIGIVFWARIKHSVNGAPSVGYVRTGHGGMRVMVDGRMYVNPVIHELTTIDLSARIIPIDLGLVHKITTSDSEIFCFQGRASIAVIPISDAIIQVARLFGDKDWLHDPDWFELIERILLDAIKIVVNQTDHKALQDYTEELHCEISLKAASMLGMYGLKLLTLQFDEILKADEVNVHAA